MLDEQFIPFVASFLTDHAVTWWRHIYMEQERLNPSALWRWNDFNTRIREQFRPITSEQAGRDRLHNLRQTTSAANYINAFQTTVINIPTMSEADRLDKFLRGLKSDIHERVAIQQPETLAEACHMANTIDTIRYYTRSQPNQFLPSSVPRNSGTIPMEVDAIRRTTLSPQDRERLRKTGGCFFCREVGHMARDCPRKKKSVTAVETRDILDTEEEEGKDIAQ